MDGSLILSMAHITGQLSGGARITGQLSGGAHITGQLSGAVNITGILSIPTYIGIDPYEGTYELNPDFIGTTLPTTNKTLTMDISVKPILVESVTNLSGGETVYIGGIY